jgi:hypothetical protein
VRVLIAAETWAVISGIAGIAAVVVAIALAAWQVRATKAKSRVGVKAYVDATWHMKVVVDNEKGSNPVTITSVAPMADGRVVPAKKKPERRKVGAGETEVWSFDVEAPDRASPKAAKVRVDSGRKHWVVEAEFGHVLVD